MGLFGNKSEKLEVVEEPEEKSDETVIQECQEKALVYKTPEFKWSDSKLKSKALKVFKAMEKAADYGLKEQVELQLKRLYQLVFEDYMKAQKIKVQPLDNTEVSHVWFSNYDNSNNPRTNNSVPYHHHNLNGPVRMPLEAFKALEALQNSPIPVEDVRILTEKRHSEHPDPILAVKVMGQHYSVYGWEDVNSFDESTWMRPETLDQIGSRNLNRLSE